VDQHVSVNGRYNMKLSPLGGKLAEPSMLVNVPRLVTAYYAERPDPAIAAIRRLQIMYHP
jgi:hypothetical protein